ncbi:hypothetical protein EMIHUDRAFT_457326, partial [Emiliania huxleyi CCMP1516]|uniref:GHMP kinase N-terminal domain-containing protein n=2 Tax=Emiliania huxleyi TaxID=2903 RepID=A0A0D3JT52_EMIH1
MFWTATTRSGAPHKLDGDVASFAALLGRLAARDGGLSDEEAAAAELFDWTAPLHVARSPGRLDVMGGIADYSGSRVLQMPIGEACLVAAQRQPASAGVRAASFGSAAGGRTSVVHVALSELAGPAGPVPLAELRARLTSDGRAAWAAYVIGCLGVLYHDGAVSPADGGLAILVASDVPEAAGVSSSAAVEVASMSALLAALGKPPLSPDEKLALLCQKVENEVVGAPCGERRRGTATTSLRATLPSPLSLSLSLSLSRRYHGPARLRARPRGTPPLPPLPPCDRPRHRPHP